MGKELIRSIEARLCIRLSRLDPKVLSESLMPDDAPPRNFYIKHDVKGKLFCYDVRTNRVVIKDILTLLSMLDEVSRLTEVLEKCLIKLSSLRELGAT